MVKEITIRVPFDDSFTPPEKFDVNHWSDKGKCNGCPFYCEQDDPWFAWCALAPCEPEEDDNCPINKYF